MVKHRDILVARKPALSLIPPFFMEGKANGETEDQLINRVKEFLLASDNEYQDDDNTQFYAECLYECYLGLYESSLKGEEKSD